MKGFFYVQPEVAGASVSGPARSPVCLFDTWLGDDLVRAHPLLLATTPLVRALRSLDNPSGFTVARVRVRSSPFFRRHAKGGLPVFWSLQANGTPGRDDAAVTGDGSLVVSERVLDVLMQFRLVRAAFAQHSKGASDRGTAGILSKTGTRSLFEIPESVGSRWPRGARDFDFLEGEWVIHHRRLRERLTGSTEWQEFETPFVMQRVLGGLGNIDQCRTTDGAFFEGVSLRLFDLADGLWRIYWIDSSGARLFPPVVGSFDGPEGVFRGEDSHEGRPVLVTFRWDRRDPSRPVWQQAFSADGGRSWETNWFMHFRRAGG